MLSISPEQVASAKAGPAGGGWINVDMAILDHAAVKLEVRTTDGEKLKLMLMRGEGRCSAVLVGASPTPGHGGTGRVVPGRSVNRVELGLEYPAAARRITSPTMADTIRVLVSGAAGRMGETDSKRSKARTT